MGSRKIGGEEEKSSQAIEDSGGILPRHLRIEQDANTPRVHSAEFTEIIDDGIYHDP